MLLYRVGDAEEATGEHAGYIAGRKVDGYLTGISTDVRGHRGDCYVAYVPRCICGWTGPPFSPTPRGFAAGTQLWRDKHLAPFLRACEPRENRLVLGWTPRVIHGSLTHARQ